MSDYLATSPSVAGGPQIPSAGRRRTFIAMSKLDDFSAPRLAFKITMKGQGVTVDKEIDSDTAAEVLALIMGGSQASAGATGATTPSRRRSRSAKQTASKPATARGGKPKSKARQPGVVNDLNLRPKGKQSFVDFAGEKKPRGHFEQQVVILYWLRHTGGMSAGITLDHVNTCYTAAGWRRPANFAANMSLTAARKRWIDTSDMSNIVLTTLGEDEVKHNLPPAQTKR